MVKIIRTETLTSGKRLKVERVENAQEKIRMIINTLGTGEFLDKVLNVIAPQEVIEHVVLYQRQEAETRINDIKHDARKN